MCFFFQAEDGIRDTSVTGVQTCALPIFALPTTLFSTTSQVATPCAFVSTIPAGALQLPLGVVDGSPAFAMRKIGRASCRERGWIWARRGAWTKERIKGSAETVVIRGAAG